MFHHPTDSMQWKHIDDGFPQFGKEQKNIWLGLVRDKMNPFGNLSTNLGLLVIYNLSPKLHMKRKYMILPTMISIPIQPKNDIIVYLCPLIEDLKLFWYEGVEVFDEFANESFQMHVMLFFTINNFPTCGNLLEYNIKGHKACLLCEEDIAS